VSFAATIDNVKRQFIQKKTVLPVLAVLIGVVAWLAFGVFSVQSLFIDNRVNEALPTAASGASSNAGQGTFESGAHTTKGTIRVLTGTGGTTFLRFENFSTENGPDLKVYLRKRETDRFVSLGSLKGNIGSQNYVLASDINVADYDTVDIWCSRFSVSFGTATLRSLKTQS
jgi:Electron transfer DM13